MLSYAVKLQKRGFIFKKETLILNSLIFNPELFIELLSTVSIINQTFLYLDKRINY